MIQPPPWQTKQEVTGPHRAVIAFQPPDSFHPPLRVRGCTPSPTPFREVAERPRMLQSPFTPCPMLISRMHLLKDVHPR